jgi:hypothetical protein
MGKIYKNMPFNSLEDGLFSEENLGEDVVDGIEIVNIDLESIEEKSVSRAREMVEDLANFYYDEEFLKENPNFKRQMEIYKEDLRLLLKMKDADEKLQDILIKSIGQNPSNASLFMANTKIQTQISNLITKINDIVDKLTAMMKNYQLELNFKYEQEVARKSVDDDEPQSIENMSTTTRGAKEFIQKMEAVEETLFNNEELVEVDIDKL